ncbi:MAG TPA: hypothetical protein VG795_12000 [Acidimicrobiia bacterium]|nr:hypothetical protein [Acidimicrobiia bacterium]
MIERVRRLAGFATSGVLLGVLALSPAMPVSALDQAAHTIRVTENQKVEKEFGPIPAMNPLPIAPPAPAPKLNTPEQCRQQPYCDVIPLEVVLPPTLKPADEFFVSVNLEWKTERIDGISAGGHEYVKPTDVNDMDLYVWDDPIGEEPIVQSATSATPEFTRLFRPSKGKYSIVVFNFSGPNTGYKLTVEYRPEHIVPPFESLAPDFTPIETPPDPLVAPIEEPEAPVELPIDTSGEDFTPLAPPPAPPAEAAPAPLTPVAIDPDPDFTNFADDAFDEQLAAPATDVLTEKQVKAVGPPRAASAGSLIFWLAIVPMLLLAGGGIWFSKKGSAVLKLR